MLGISSPHIHNLPVYDTSQELRDSVKVANPLAMLDQLGDMVKATGKTSEQLVDEHLAGKYNL